MFEYCIFRSGDEEKGPHRIGSKVFCEQWIQDWLDDGGKGSVFYTARRWCGPWHIAPDVEHLRMF